jgi:hypothetical protein
MQTKAQRALALSPPPYAVPTLSATGRPLLPRVAPEELLQAGVAEAVATGRNLHGLAHGLPAQRAQQPSLGLLQEFIVEAGHGERAAGTGQRGRARGGPTARASLRPRSPLRAPPTGRRGLGPAREPAHRKRGRSCARAVLAPAPPTSRVLGSAVRCNPTFPGPPK